MTQCCANPKLAFRWILGTNDQQLVLDIGAAFCEQCGTRFRFEGIVTTRNDRSGITLEISKIPNAYIVN
jgi:hypothetical protein